MNFHTHSFAKTLAAALIGGLLVGAALAQEVTSLRGKPSSDMILQALTPAASPEAPAAPAAYTVRRRGLSLGGEPPPAPAPEAAAPVQAAATVQAAAPMQAPSQAVAPIPAAPQPPQARALDLEIPFQFNSDQLTNDGKDVLDQLAGALKSNKLASARYVVLEGHADAKGNPGYNQALSYKRALSARAYLNGRHGIPDDKMRAVGKGASELADPANPESEVNRRVRVIVAL